MQENVRLGKGLVWAFLVPFLGCLCAGACTLPTPKGLSGDGGNDTLIGGAGTDPVT